MEKSKEKVEIWQKKFMKLKELGVILESHKNVFSKIVVWRGGIID